MGKLAVSDFRQYNAKEGASYENESFSPNFERDFYVKRSRSGVHWKNEVDALNHLQDVDSVVRLIASDKKNKTITLEKIPGTSLDQHADDSAPSEIKSLDIIHQCAILLNQMHSKGLVHCDVSLRNFILEDGIKLGHSGAVSIRAIDFELTYDLEAHEKSEVLKNKSLNGTALYCSPEKLSGLFEYGQSSDVFALGVMWYRLTEGSFPFDPCIGKLERQIFLCEPEPPRKTDKYTAEMIMMCLAKSPVNRPTAGQVCNWCSAVS